MERMVEGTPQKLSAPYPMVRVMHRQLGPFYEGPVYVWDVDKTYLDTRFSQLKHLLRIPFEFGVDKQAVAGTVELLKGLREGAQGSQYRPLFFVSASPPQIRGAIERKMLLDGVDFDGITYKNAAVVLRRLQFDQLKEQVAFKLCALSLLFKELPEGARLHLFGDNAEKDQAIYSLFAKVASGACRGTDLHARLLSEGVRQEYADNAVRLAASLPTRECVDGIYIHLVREQAPVPDASCFTWSHADSLAARLLSRGLVSQQCADAVRSALA